MTYAKNRVSVYLAVKMTGRYEDEVLEETLNAKERLERKGFRVLSPVLEEGIQNRHIRIQASPDKLKRYWRRDKEMIQEADIMVDYLSQGKSDGVNVEMGLMRFGYWKPLFRVHPDLGFTVSRIEYDNVVSDVDSLLKVLSKFNTKSKLFRWRMRMLVRTLPKFLLLQLQFLWRII